MARLNDSTLRKECYSPPPSSFNPASSLLNGSWLLLPFRRLFFGPETVRLWLDFPIYQTPFWPTLFFSLSVHLFFLWLKLIRDFYSPELLLRMILCLPSVHVLSDTPLRFVLFLYVSFPADVVPHFLKVLVNNEEVFLYPSNREWSIQIHRVLFVCSIVVSSSPLH